VKGIDLKVLRIRAGVRQYELAAQLGMNPSRLSLVESGRVPLAPDVASRAAIILSGGDMSAARHSADSSSTEA
jgi:transcriptional regulator with XRE-family HTH domain